VLGGGDYVYELVASAPNIRRFFIDAIAVKRHIPT
jgi:hypothetical protein